MLIPPGRAKLGNGDRITVVMSDLVQQQLGNRAAGTARHGGN